MGSHSPPPPPPEQQFILVPCTPLDIPSMITIYLSAFSTDPFSAATFPRDAIAPSEFNRWLTNRFQRTFQQPEIRTFKIVDTLTGQMCALARWAFPYEFSPEELQKKEEEKKEKEALKAKGEDDSWPLGANLAICLAKFGGIDAARSKHCSAETDYAIQLLYVSPEYQRKGLASMLLRYGLEMADREGKRAYIEATAKGKVVYERLGFEVVDLVEVDLKEWGGEGVERNWIMVREPKKAMEK
ncbi:acyl-CoA N-acyltransferase [Halenospora varia]|nr:acyl-CoA N-acyltransferase [Halenospora varia]